MINDKVLRWSVRGITLAAIVALLGEELGFVFTEYSEALLHFVAYMAVVAVGILCILFIEGVGKDEK